MSVMSPIESAILLALYAHQGQVDKAGAPYILHSLHLMSQMESEEEKIVAILHDAIEDSGLTLEEIRNEFSLEIEEALEALTKRKGEEYEEYIQRVKDNVIATRVKVADLQHNLDITRIPEEEREKYHSLMEKYRRALEALKGSHVK